MNKNNKSPYATNKGGKIEAPNKPSGEPKSTKTTANDLRIKRG